MLLSGFAVNMYVAGMVIEPARVNVAAIVWPILKLPAVQVNTPSTVIVFPLAIVLDVWAVEKVKLLKVV
ncbi:MAG: hypothetical protein KKG95_07980, partial [Candidatus Omnitrophica bacterium]|nr:hypothetical protein [Candidatus Omnitrophota bacterium]